MGYGWIVASEHSRRKHLPGRRHENRQRASTACTHAWKRILQEILHVDGNRFTSLEIESGSDQRDGHHPQLRNHCGFPASEELNVKVRTMR
jgi:hypothetical protein